MTEETRKTRTVTPPRWEDSRRDERPAESSVQGANARNRRLLTERRVAEWAAWRMTASMPMPNRSQMRQASPPEACISVRMRSVRSDPRVQTASYPRSVA